jgi:hypothetical protein
VLQRELGVSAPTARAAIDALAKAGVLIPHIATKRNRVWDAVGVLAALGEFAEASRRNRGGAEEGSGCMQVGDPA